MGQIIEVDFRYTRTQLQTLVDWARIQYVGADGRYGVPADVINVWSCPWLTPDKKTKSKLKGSFYVVWDDENRISKIAVEEGYSQSDMLDELAILEEEALGRFIHGQNSK